ncbi:hypothetical protein J3P88_10160 [Pseudomonas sp. Z3-6]|uniref:hypothetical protein n=1 Tax=Pseudomonas sp. Z3-6 TaxID=2817411 RepID=UPI003DA807AA
MRKLLGGVGFVMFFSASGLGLWLLLEKNLSGTEFVSFVVAFTLIGGVVAFAPEIQEFSVAGNVVKLREVKNDALKSIEVLKKTQAEVLRLMLRSRDYLDQQISYDVGHLAIDKDFWDIVSEAKRIGAIDSLKPMLLPYIDRMLFDLYRTAYNRSYTSSNALSLESSFAEVAAELLDPDRISRTLVARDEREDFRGHYTNFVKGRLAEMESLYALKRELKS